ncbi:hypothetical protein D3C85_290660 [compost metagenome]
MDGRADGAIAHVVIPRIAAAKARDAFGAARAAIGADHQQVAVRIRAHFTERAHRIALCDGVRIGEGHVRIGTGAILVEMGLAQRRIECARSRIDDQFLPCLISLDGVIAQIGPGRGRQIPGRRRIFPGFIAVVWAKHQVAQQGNEVPPRCLLVCHVHRPLDLGNVRVLQVDEDFFAGTSRHGLVDAEAGCLAPHAAGRILELGNADRLAIDKLRIVVAVDFDRQPADRFRRQIKRIMAVAHAGNADRWVYRVLFRAIHQVFP